MQSILFIILNDIDLGNNNSGPSVRSLSILNEFKKKGLNIDIIMGANPKERFLKFKELPVTNNYDYCYIESKVGVTRLYDTLILKLIKKKFNNVKTGLYYRDMYWAYNIQISKGKLKNILVPIVNKWFLGFLSKNVNVIFGQSNSFCEKLKTFTRNECEVKVLPPGCEQLPVKQSTKKGVVYVGEIDQVFSGIELLIEAMELVNMKQRVPLNLVCRKNEYQLNDYLQKVNAEHEWLNIYHETKETIYKVYNKSNLAIIPRYKDEYTKLCLPIKLFEYITYELPIVAIKHGEVAKFIEEKNIGMTCIGNPNELAEKILKTINLDERDKKSFINNIRKCKKDNTWKERVEFINETLYKKNT